MGEISEKITDRLSQVIERIIEEVHNGEHRVWTKGWAESIAGVTPTNAVSMAPYHGINELMLGVTELDEGYPTSWWAGYRQWQDLGMQVGKAKEVGHGTLGIRPERRSSCATCGQWGTPGCETPGHDVKRWLVFKSFHVWNVAQVTGDWIPPHVPALEPRTIDDFDLFVKRTGAQLLNKVSDEAAYIPSLDIIKLPLPGQFDSREEEASTTAHELVHWTGHHSRLDRPSIAEYTVDNDVAHQAVRGYEEFIAELGSAQLTELYGFHGRTVERHVGYLQHWLTNTLNTPTDLISAASASRKAVEYLLSLSQ